MLQLEIFPNLEKADSILSIVAPEDKCPIYILEDDIFLSFSLPLVTRQVDLLERVQKRKKITGSSVLSQKGNIQ